MRDAGGPSGNPWRSTTNSNSNGNSAIVIGAGMAGLVTARVLSDHCDTVTILEGNRLPADATSRKGPRLDVDRLAVCQPTPADST